MRRSRLIPIPISARLLIGLLFAISSFVLSAQAATESHAGRGFGPAYDAANETTLTGAIQEVVTKHVTGSPAGMHLLVSAPEGVVDVQVGPFLSQETKQTLQAGAPVQIVGATIQLREKQYFLARVLSVAGTTVTVRSTRGFLIEPHAGRVVKTTSNAQAKGGVR